MTYRSVALAVASLVVVLSGTADACPARVHVRARHAHVPPAAPSARSLAQYNLDRVNAYRAARGLAPLTLDATLSSFAQQGSAELMTDHRPHGHFANAGDALWREGFRNAAAENQGAPEGWGRLDADPTRNAQRQIDDILASMMREGPSGGHYGNIMNPKLTRLGVGLIEDASGRLFFTNDFSA